MRSYNFINPVRIRFNYNPSAMTKKDNYSSGPKTGKGKAVSSRNSLTHGLTARRWLDANEQSLFDGNVEAFSKLRTPCLISPVARRDTQRS